MIPTLALDESEEESLVGESLVLEELGDWFVFGVDREGGVDLDGTPGTEKGGDNPGFRVDPLGAGGPETRGGVSDGDVCCCPGGDGEFELLGGGKVLEFSGGVGDGGGNDVGGGSDAAGGESCLGGGGDELLGGDWGGDCGGAGGGDAGGDGGGVAFGVGGGGELLDSSGGGGVAASGVGGGGVDGDGGESLFVGVDGEGGEGPESSFESIFR